MFDIITIGNASLDIFLTVKEANLSCQKNKCLLCLPYGSKIPVQEYTVSVGGNAANCAVGFSKLGLQTGIITVLGKDETSLKIIDKLKREKVATSFIKTKPFWRANSSVVLDIPGKRDRTVLSYHFPKKFEIAKIPQTKWIYLTSIGHEFSRVWRVLKQQITILKSPIKISFNPGGYEIKQGFNFLKNIVKNTQIFIVNKEEARQITAQNTQADEKEIGKLLQNIHTLGAKISVITDGEKGVYSYDGLKTYCEPVLKIKPVEVTGAGDSFAAGFTSAIFYGLNIQRSLRWGILNSNFCIQKIGAQNGLLTFKAMKLKEREYYNSISNLKC